MLDALSQAPVFSPAEDDGDVNFVNKVSFHKMDFILESVRNDDSYNMVKEALLQGKKPNGLPPNHPGRAYKSFWDDLSVVGEVGCDIIVYDGTRVVIPTDARKQILKMLHISHSGITKTRKAAQQLYFWPGMSNDIKQMVENCEECLKLLPSQSQEPIIQSKEECNGPMSHVSTDLFELDDYHYLVMVDRYSGYTFVERLRKLSTDAIIDVLENWFLEYGYPNVIRSDGGPQFRSKFNEFCEAKGITKETSSPYNPQSPMD